MKTINATKRKTFLNKVCQVCSKNYKVISTRRVSKLCSTKCRNTYNSKRMKKYATERVGIKHPNWTGSKVGYSAIHDWIARCLGKANHCEKCGLNAPPKDKKLYFQWSNRSGKYKRNLKDWQQLCRKCHWAYDKIGERMSNLRKVKYWSSRKPNPAIEKIKKALAE